LKRLITAAGVLAVLALAGTVRAEGAAPEYRHLGPTPPPNGLPHIIAYTISSTQLRPGDTVSGTVEASPNVGYVEVRLQYQNQAMQRTGPGTFAFSYHVPRFVPPWLRHAYTLEIVARSVDGVEVWQAVPIRIL